jgi:hypothetical protein
MSKFVYACFRSSDDPRLAGRASPANLARIAAAIAPDNIASRPPRDLLRQPAVIGHVLDEVGRTGSLAPELHDLAQSVARRALWAGVHRPIALATDVLANVIRRRVYSPRNMQRFNVDYGVAVFRVYIALAMVAVLREDAKRLARG